MPKKYSDICPPECCDMKGLLSFLILWLLSKKPMYGQELAKEIGKRKGTKPNPGTIYPALRELKKRGLIQLKREGRITNYHITEKGRRGIQKACEYFCKAFGEIFQEHMEVVPLKVGQKVAIVPFRDRILVQPLPEKPEEKLSELTKKVVFNREARKKASEYLLSQGK